MSAQISIAKRHLVLLDLVSKTRDNARVVVVVHSEVVLGEALKFADVNS